MSDFMHLFQQGAADQPVMVLLHGTGGDERDLLGLAHEIAPTASVLSVRGKILENGMPRFFKRKSEGIFDMEDLVFRTDELAAFIDWARQEYGFVGKEVYALGYSNGANIAARMLFQRPEILSGAILMRAMMPWTPDTVPDLSGKTVLVLSGAMDSIIPYEDTQALLHWLNKAKARTMPVMQQAGHNLVPQDIEQARNWWTKLDKPVS